jgi:hypothetical protein
MAGKVIGGSLLGGIHTREDAWVCDNDHPRHCNGGW